MVHPEGCLPLITFLYSHVIVSPSYVQFCKVLGLRTGDPIYNIWDEGKWIGVLYCHCIELPVVLNEPEFSMLFINEKDWGCHRGLGGAYPTSPEVHLQKVVEFLLFNQRQGVHLCTECLGIREEFYGVIPLSSLWQFIEGLF